MSAPSLMTQAGVWWSARAPREQRLLVVAAALIASSFLYALAVSPALKVLRTHSENQSRLQNDWQTMVQLQSQARALQSQPRQNATAARAALQSSVQSLGAQADMSFGPEGARLVLRNVDGQTLAQWLAAARTQAGSVPVQASISRNGAAWSGTVLMTLPPQ